MAQQESQVPQARWTRRKEARPGEILDAAVAVFAEKGFAATRMEDIAKRAGVTKGTIYLYFQGKEDVFKSLVRESIGERIRTVGALVKDFPGPASELLRTALTTMATFMRTTDRVVLPKIFIAEAGNFPELALFYRETVVDQGLGVFSAIIAKGIAEGEFRPVDPGHAARLCIAPVLLMMLWLTTFAKFDRVPYDYDGYLKTHLDTLLRGLSAKGETS